MKHLKLYKIFESDTNEYSIYDWFEDLKRYQWSKNQKSMVNESSLKKWSDHFIGEGYWEKIKDLVDRMFVTMSKVDTDYINDRMYDVYDEIPESKDKWTMCCVAYGDYENHDNYKEIGDVNQSDAGLVKIDELITALQELKEKGANYVACDWHCDHVELEVHGFNYRKSTYEEVKVVEDEAKAKKELLKQRQIKEMEDKLAKLKAE